MTTIHLFNYSSIQLLTSSIVVCVQQNSCKHGFVFTYSTIHIDRKIGPNFEIYGKRLSINFEDFGKNG